MRHLEFSSPHNWCDRACERCVLASVCPCAPSPGQDSADAWADVTWQLQVALQMLEEQARADGISLDDLPPPAQPTVSGALLEQAATRLAHSLRAVGLRRSLGLLLASKAARLAALVDDPDTVWQADGVPNLLLVERVLAQVTHELQRRRPSLAKVQRERVDLHLEQLTTCLAPLVATIPLTARALMDILIDAGRAPSPFVTTDQRPATETFQLKRPPFS